MKAEGRTGWGEGGEGERREEREEGCYSHYIMNEVRSHIFAVESLFILFCCALEPLNSTPLYTQKVLLSTCTIHVVSIHLRALEAINNPDIICFILKSCGD